MRTLYYNVHGEEQNQCLKHIPNGQMNKKLRDFFFKNPSMRAFLHGVEKRDERFIIQALKNIEFEAGENVIKKGTWDKSVLFVAGGELMAFGQDENVVHKEGAILGIEQFLFDKPWDADYLCKSQATVCKLKHESLLNLVTTNAQAASRLYKRIMRHYCYSQIYERKASNIAHFRNVRDADLFIDFKLDLKNEKELLVFESMTNPKPLAEMTNKEREQWDGEKEQWERENGMMSLADQAKAGKGPTKGQELDTMPYFLTAQFKEILDKAEKAKPATIDSQGSLPKAKIGGGGGMYRSEFLVRKIAQQNEKKKTDRLANKGRPAAGSNKDGAGAKGKKAVVPPTESEEALVQIIEDLRSDLQIRD